MSILCSQSWRRQRIEKSFIGNIKLRPDGLNWVTKVQNYFIKWSQANVRRTPFYLSRIPKGKRSQAQPE
ncbi:hypothetical protein LINPERPRIM_LOCUS32418 [Linum perenne]